MTSVPYLPENSDDSDISALEHAPSLNKTERAKGNGYTGSEYCESSYTYQTTTMATPPGKLDKNASQYAETGRIHRRSESGPQESSGQQSYPEFSSTEAVNKRNNAASSPIRSAYEGVIDAAAGKATGTYATRDRLDETVNLEALESRISGERTSEKQTVLRDAHFLSSLAECSVKPSCPLSGPTQPSSIYVAHSPSINLTAAQEQTPTSISKPDQLRPEKITPGPSFPSPLEREYAKARNSLYQNQVIEEVGKQELVPPPRAWVGQDVRSGMLHQEPAPRYSQTHGQQLSEPLRSFTDATFRGEVPRIIKAADQVQRLYEVTSAGSQQSLYSIGNPVYDSQNQQRVMFAPMMPQSYQSHFRRPRDHMIHSENLSSPLVPSIGSNSMTPAWVQTPVHEQQSFMPMQILGPVSGPAAQSGRVKKPHRRTRSRTAQSRSKSLSKALETGNTIYAPALIVGLNERNSSDEEEGLAGGNYWGILSQDLDGSEDAPPVPIQLCEPPLSDSVPANAEALKSDPEPRNKKRSKYTPEQDHTILELKAEGVSWSEIAERAHCDNSLAARNRYQVLIGQQGGGMYTWTQRDCEALQSLLDEGERAKWLFIADAMSKRRNKNFSMEACHYKISQLFASSPESFGVVRTREKIGGGVPMRRRPLKPRPSDSSDEFE